MPSAEQAALKRTQDAIRDCEHVTDGLCGDCAVALVAQAIEQARRKEREECMTIMRKNLVYDSQRAVSWHEIQDCLDAIRARGEER